MGSEIGSPDVSMPGTAVTLDSMAQTACMLQEGDSGHYSGEGASLD